MYRYHGQSKKIGISRLQSCDIVLTTYATLTAESNRNKNLLRIKWWRIVLDEGDNVASQKTVTSANEL